MADRGTGATQHGGSLAAHGLMDDELMPYVPGVNCLTCGRFVGRDGWIGIDYFEMSTEVSAVEGECGACLRKVPVDA